MPYDPKIQLNTLSYRIDAEAAISDPMFIVAMNNVDEWESIFSFNIFALEQSAKRDGRFPILNCSCGVFGCGGFFVEVENTPEVIIWHRLWILPKETDVSKSINSIRLGDEHKYKMPLCFSRSEYEALIADLLAKKDQSYFDRHAYESGELSLKKNDPYLGTF